MSKPIDRIRAKVTRAREHVREFQRGVRHFHETTPYEVAIREDARADKRIYYVSRADNVPDSLTTIAADAIQNLRSPLDHIAYQIVVDALGGDPSYKVYYPITSAATEYPSLCAQNMKGVRQEVVQAIDATEPYKGGKGHALWQLNELNKLDKHRMLVGAGAIAGVDLAAGFRAEFPELGPVFFREMVSTPLTVGHELYIEGLDQKIALDRQFLFDVSIYAPTVIELQPAQRTLEDMATLVEDVIDRLGRFLP